MAAPMTMFVDLAASWDATVSAGVSQTVASAITANATLLATMLSLFIISAGTLTMFGRLSMSEWTFYATRAATISMLVTAEGFNKYIQQPLMVDIPNWIAQSAGGAGLQTAPQQFDALRDQVVVMEVSVIQQAAGFSGIAQRLIASVTSGMINFELLMSFAIWEFSRAMMGMLVTVAPFLLGLYLFRSTRHVVMNLAGQALTILIMMVIMTVLLSMTLQIDRNEIAKLQAANASIDVVLDVMWQIFLFFGFGVSMTLFVPILAGRIGHGVFPHVSSALGAPYRTMKNAVSRERLRSDR